MINQMKKKLDKFCVSIGSIFPFWFTFGIKVSERCRTVMLFEHETDSAVALTQLNTQLVTDRWGQLVRSWLVSGNGLSGSPQVEPLYISGQSQRAHGRSKSLWAIWGKLKNTSIFSHILSCKFRYVVTHVFLEACSDIRERTLAEWPSEMPRFPMQH